MSRRLMVWSVRRELWENRSVILAPLAVATVAQVATLIATLLLPSRIHSILALNPAKQRQAIVWPFSVIAGMVLVTSFLVGVFYCLDALHGERRDRSILFWKALPISDRTTVLSKASIPLVVLPLLCLVIIVPAQVILLLLSNVVLIGNGPGLAALWKNVQFLQSAIALIYALITFALWQAPVYAWMLLVSAWARRAAFLWAVLPFLVIAAFEKIAFNSTHIFLMLGDRMTGWLTHSAVVQPKGATSALGPLERLTPIEFVSTPGLWIGLVFAALCLTAAVRLRRKGLPL